jgi:hypothetical protein
MTLPNDSDKPVTTIFYNPKDDTYGYMCIDFSKYSLQDLYKIQAEVMGLLGDVFDACAERRQQCEEKNS